jgi:hypothetical protein
MAGIASNLIERGERVRSVDYLRRGGAACCGRCSAVFHVFSLPGLGDIFA